MPFGTSTAVAQPQTVQRCSVTNSSEHLRPGKIITVQSVSQPPPQGSTGWACLFVCSCRSAAVAARAPAASAAARCCDADSSSACRKSMSAILDAALLAVSVASCLAASNAVADCASVCCASCFSACSSERHCCRSAVSDRTCSIDAAWPCCQDVAVSPQRVDVLEERLHMLLRRAIAATCSADSAMALWAAVAARSLTAASCA